MNEEQISNCLNKIQNETELCFSCLENNDIAGCLANLKNREISLYDLKEKINSFKSYNVKSENDTEPDILVALDKIIKQITKDSIMLTDYIDREKKKTLVEIKKLKNGKKVLLNLRKKIRNKRIVSKTI